MPEILIEAKNISINGIPVKHLYLVYRDAAGDEWVIRGGPLTGWDTVGGDFEFQVNVEIDSSADFRGSETPQDRHSTIVDTGALSADEAWAIMVRYAGELSDLNYPPYFATGTNSNAFVGAMLEAIGLQPASNLPDGVSSLMVPGLSSYSTITGNVTPPENGDVLGTGGDDAMTGIQIDEVFRGFNGTDAIYAAGGNDQLYGGNDRDFLHGEGGNDLLVGGAGADRLTGGSQSDVFFFHEDDYPLFQDVNPDQITDFNQGNTGSFSSSEGDLIDLSGFNFATGTGFGTTSTVRLRSIEASGGLPAGAILEVNTGAGTWRAIARLDNVSSGQSVLIALSDAQSTSRTGTEFVVDSVGNGTTWSISPASRNVTEGDVTITFTITRSGTSLPAETVYVSTAQTQGFYNDGDYVGRANVAISFAAGETNATFTVQINADAFTESDETFGVIVQSDSNDPVSTFLTSATFTIEDDAAPSVSGDTYFGDGLGNTWSGTEVADLAFGQGGNDSLSGDGGNDILFGGDGNDTLSGGAGNDTIVAGGGVNYVDAGSGNDYVDARVASYANGTILGGTGNDTIIAGSSNSTIYQRSSELRIDGGAGVDLAIIESQSPGYNRSGFTHRFGDGPTISASSSFDDISAAIAGGGSYRVSTASGGYSGYVANSFILLENIERIEYRGGNQANLFLDWNGSLTAAHGGTGIDALYADWSSATSAIVWNMTVNNDTEKTLSNGVVVQSIERAMLRTGSGNDHLVLGDQNDHVETGAGNDTIYGGNGSDTLNGGWGNDDMRGGNAADAMEGQNGNDTILGQHGNDTLLGGFGDDSLNGGLNNDSLDGGGNNDTLEGYNGADTLIGGAGNDSILGQQGNDLIYGGFGMDTLNGGGDGDTIFGGDQADYIDGSFGFDSVHGGSGNDTIFGGTANDTLLGNAGNDSMEGGFGFDFLDGGGGDDTMFGDQQGDTILGNVGNDSIEGGAGNDSLDGGGDNDTLRGGDNQDTLDGGFGDDVLYGDDDRDLLNGGGNNDNLFGGAGNDTLNGDNGEDTLRGGTGDDLLFGGNQSDTFVFAVGQDMDTVMDYTAIDTLRLNSNLWSGVLTAQQVVDTFANEVGGNVVFDFGGGDIFVIANQIDAQLLVANIDIF